jgi:hypothetical protein
LAAASCTLPKKDAPRPVVAVEPPTAEQVWKGIATADDQARLARLDEAWQRGLADARAVVSRADLNGEGKLLVPKAGEAKPAPTPGSYSCRLITLGKEGGKGPSYQKFKPFFCYVLVQDDQFTIVKQTGSQRPAGRLWDDNGGTNRLIFLGTLALGNEDEARAYGEDPRRDMAGVFERIGPFKWRLVIPFPKDGAKLDVFELTPVPDQPAE